MKGILFPVAISFTLVSAANAGYICTLPKWCSPVGVTFSDISANTIRITCNEKDNVQVTHGLRVTLGSINTNNIKVIGSQTATALSCDFIGDPLASVRR